MKVDTMRKLDRSLGVPICWLLSILVWVGRLFRPPRRGRVEDVKSLLFVKLAEMGNTVLCHPALAKARDQWPDVEIIFLVFAENVPSVELLEIVPPENIYTIRSDNLAVFCYDSISCIWRLRRRRITAAIDLEFFSRATSCITHLTGARSTVGYHRYTMEGLYKGAMFSHPVQYNCHMHTAASFVTLVEALDCDWNDGPLVKLPTAADADLRFPRFAATPEQRQQMLDLIAGINPAYTSETRLVILNVNASDLLPLRRWPLANFIGLAKRLIERPDVLIVLIGIASEAEESRKVLAAIGAERCIDLVGRTTLKELIVLFELSDLLVSNDSGPPHFANLTALPTINLFGPESPVLYRPLGARKVAITAGLACSPCVSAYNHRKSPCTNNVCMQAISIEQVLSHCDELLAPETG